jgi:hypothetical protein
LNRRGILLAFAATLGLCVLPLPAHAARGESFQVELRVLEATPGPGPADIDPKLAGLARDLKGLPFKSIQLFDRHSTNVAQGQRVSFEFPGKQGQKRFLVVEAHGRQAGGKLRFQLSIAELKFDTLVAVPDGGTIVVAGPKHDGKTLMFAVTAKTR